MALVVYALLLVVTLQPVSAGDCEPYYKNGQYQWRQSCVFGERCCGTCDNRYCCRPTHPSNWLSKYEQEMCDNKKDFNSDFDKNFRSHHELPTFFKVFIPFFVILFVASVIYICWKKCNSPTPVVATTTHATVVASTQYPQNPTPTQQHPGHYPGNQQYPGHYPGNPQPGYGAPAPYGGQPMPSAAPQGPANTVFGPPPSYQDVAGPGGYPVNYSGAAFPPGQQSYPMQPPVHAGYQNQNQPMPSASADLNAQPAYNPNYVAPPKILGYV